MPDYQVLKRIAQANFRWSPLFFSHGGDVASSLSDKLPEMAMETARWRMRNAERRWSAFFGPDVAWLSWEASSDMNGFATHFMQLQSAVERHLEVAEVTRLGVRAMAMVPVASFEEARARVVRTFCALDSWAALGGTPQDIQVVLEHGGKPGSPQSRLTLGPMTPDEFAGKHPQLLENSEGVEIPTGCFVDFDLWAAPNGKLSSSLKEMLGVVTDRIGAVAQALGEG